MRAVGQQNFVDDQFPPTPRSLYKSPHKRKRSEDIIWLRPRDIRTDHAWTVFRGNTITGTDIVQGSLGNCWFLAALSVIAEQRPELILKLVLTKTLSSYGIYQLRLCHKGVWQTVTIDDYLPCHSHYKNLVYSRSTHGQLWVSLVEKAHAKLHGSYEAVVSGSIEDGLRELTGVPCESLRLDVSKIDEIWARLESSLQSNFVLGASCGGDLGPSVYKAVGLVDNHAYSILQLEYIRGERIMLIRNPWAKTDWKGDWSATSPTWASEQERKKYYRVDRGSFWMSVLDFFKYFQTVTICKLHADYEELRYADQFGTNKSLPLHSSNSYHLSVLKSTCIYISIIQSTSRKQDKHVPPTSFILKNLNKTIEPIKIWKPKAVSHHTAELMLDTGDYILFPFALGDEVLDFVLGFYSSQPLIVEVKPTNQHNFLTTLHKGMTSPNKGISTTPLMALRFYIMSANDGSQLFLAHNTHHSAASSLEVSTTSHVLPPFSWRGSLFTQDVIPPLSSQLINVIRPGGDPEPAQTHFSATETHKLKESHFPQLTPMFSVLPIK
uniref:Calpain catalytic domain-containing protein n=1 Tax=Arcella intermedia TaxID=1963864 RepID=A0A6B2L0T4_9EUKA